MADFTLNRTVEDQENEVYELSYNVDDIPDLENNTALARAYSVWTELARDWSKAPSDTDIRPRIEKDPEYSRHFHRVCFSVAGTEFDIDDGGREALRQIGIPDALDLTARQLNNRSFASFLFFANSIVIPTYQRVIETCQGKHREYARLALPVSGPGDPVIYFLTRELAPSETALDIIREITE